NGASIGGSAAVDVTATSLSGDSLFAGITNANGGTIGSTAGVIFNVSGTSTFAHNATFEITVSDGAQAAAIDINRGSYDAGGTFLAFIDGSGAITFNNASVHANVLQVGALGTNGVLNIGGGTLSADTTLKLYAGSSGTLNFTSSVTLRSGTAMDLAANTITIQPSVRVTIAGAGGMANIYTSNANYSGFGGKNRSNGTFGGNGANSPQPLTSAPAFGDPPAASTTTNGTFAGAGATTQPLGGQPPFDSPTTARAATKQSRSIASAGRGPTIYVTDSSQLGSLLNNATLGPDGKVRISPHGRSHNQSMQGVTRTMAAELHRSVD